MSLGSTSSNTLEKVVRSSCAELGRRLRSGETCRAEEYLTRHPELAGAAETALEVIYTEYVVRLELGEPVSSDEWFVRFPQWRNDLEQLLHVHEQVVQVESDHRSRRDESRDGGSRDSQAGKVESADRAGRIVGAYQLLEEIGRGGMGVVYRARQLNLNRDVALKMVLSGEYASPRELARFQAEAESAARLQHPHIVQIHEIGAHEGRAYLTMEYVSGGALDAKLRVARLDPRAAAALLETLARTLQFAHERGVVHRDLKPGNILITESGSPKIADFGLAKQLVEGRLDQTRTGAAVGTPSYMAPEQAAGRSRDVGPATDVYGLGVILYEALCGRPPLVGDTQLDTLRRVVHDEPTPPSRIRSAVPRDLEIICLKCLEKEPRRRYASAEALAEDLRRFQANEPILARPAGPLDRLGKFARRRPDLAALAAILFFSFAAVFTLWRLAERRRGDAEEAARQASLDRETALDEQHKTQEARDRAERTLYFRRIGQAWGEIATNQVLRANQLLDECRPDMRDWEWHFLRSKATAELRAQPVHVDTIWSVAFSPNGDLVAAGTGEWGVGKAGHVFLWPLRGGPLAELPNNEHGAAMDLDFSFDGRQLAVAGRRWEEFPIGGVKIWSPAGGRRLAELPPPGDDAFCVAFNADATLLAVGTWSGLVLVWDVPAGRIRHRFSGHGGNVFGVAFHPHGERLASCGRDGAVRFWNLRTGAVDRPPFDQYGDVRRVAYSPDGRHLAFSTFSNNLYIWDLERPPDVLLKHSFDVGVVTKFAYSPEGRRIGLAGSTGGVLVIDAESGLELKRFRTSGGVVRALAFSPDGRQLVTGGMDRTLKLWDARTDWDETKIGMWRFAKCGAFERIRVTRDGKRVLLPNGRNRTRHRVGEPTLLVWDAEASRLAAVFRGHTDWLNDVDASPDGSWYATAAEDGTVRTWDAQTGETLRRLDHDRPLTNVAIHPGGEWLAAADAGGALHFWDVATGERRRTVDSGHASVRRLAFSPDGEHLVAVGDEPFLAVVAGAEGPVERLLEGEKTGALAATFSPDGRWLAVADENQQVRVWDWTRRRLRRMLKGHQGDVRDVAFSASGRRLATAGADMCVKLWDVDSEDEILSMRSDSLTSVAFHPDGRTLYATHDWNLLAWSANRPDSDVVDEAYENANLAWHTAQGAAALRAGRPLSSAFHFNRIVQLKADQLRRGTAPAADSPPSSP